MLNTYIKNQGITKTIIHSNNHNHVNQTNWNADYDGEIANISVNTNNDGRRKHFDIILDNEDLANILNVQSIDMPIDKRLKMDFQEPYYEPENYYIELPTPELEPKKPKLLEYIPTVQEVHKPHISSPVTGEELIIPLTIDRKTADKYTFTPKRRHRRLKTHVTHRVYKKPKTTTKSINKHKTKKSRSSSKKTMSSIVNFL
jgi:hypothetical protein